jgi:hypothetical protein
MATRTLCGLVLALAPVVALAECPVAADMDRGVRVTFDNGDTTELRRLDGVLIEVTERYSWDAQSLRYRADWGLYARDEVGVSPGGADIPESAIRFDYPVALPEPAADAAPWGGVRQYEEFGFDPRNEGWQVGFRAMAPVEIGGCSYQSVAVGIRLRAGEADQKDQFSYYLPELGAGFIVAWVDSGGRQDTVPVAIDVIR